MKVPPSTCSRSVSTAERAISSMIAASGFNNAVRLYFFAQRDGVDYNFAYIGPDFTQRPESPADGRPAWPCGPHAGGGGNADPARPARSAGRRAGPGARRWWVARRPAAVMQPWRHHR
ncbi:MAG TPA: hypothetical protein VGN83_04525 [Falsiroseomonas sp.]|nr:hypothetical protein [Falsiroseomonas sp.]